MADSWDQYGTIGGCNPQFSSPFTDWELDQVCSFISIIQDMKVYPEEKDRILWNLSKEGCSAVTPLCGALEGAGAGPIPGK